MGLISSPHSYSNFGFVLSQFSKFQIFENFENFWMRNSQLRCSSLRKSGLDFFTLVVCFWKSCVF